MPENKVKEFGKAVPLARPAQPAELAPPYVMLASNEASYITGAYIPVTGKADHVTKNRKRLEI